MVPRNIYCNINRYMYHIAKIVLLIIRVKTNVRVSPPPANEGVREKKRRENGTTAVHSPHVGIEKNSRIGFGCFFHT